jgi:hypothetical protein
MKSRIEEDLVILRFVDDSGVVHDIGLNSILDGGMPIDEESGEDMEYLLTYVLTDLTAAAKDLSAVFSLKNRTKPDADFEKFAVSSEQKHWAKFDLSACRIGWDAAKLFHNIE